MLRRSDCQLSPSSNETYTSRSVPANSRPFFFGILAHDVDRRAVGNAVHDLGPRLAAVVSAEDVRAHVVEPQRVDGGVGGERVEVAGVENRTFIHGPSCGGVTSFQCAPPSAVVWIRPSSVPAQMRLTSSGEGATA